MENEHGALAIINLLTCPAALAIGYYLLVTGNLVSGKEHEKLYERLGRIEQRIDELSERVDRLTG